MSFKKSSFVILPLYTKQGLAAVLLAGLAWLAVTPASHQAAWAQDALAAASSENGSAKPAPDNSQFVEAWISDLKQTSEHWIQIDLSDQRLTAWEGSTPVFSIIVSTGRADEMTPTGVYSIQDKYRTARMQGENYDIPDVPYTMYFSGSYAIHGAYWHNNFGTPVSSGCINVPVDGAAWLFDWAGAGTPVVVQN